MAYFFAGKFCFPQKIALMSDYWHSAKIVTGIITRRIITGPHSVQVSLVDACNYRCIMCWEHSSELEGWGADELAREYHDRKKLKSTVMDLDLYKEFATSLRQTGTRQIGLSGIGEPLLHKDVVETVSFAKSLGMSVWITTNGSRLNQDLMRDLAMAGLDDLSVSINAGAPDEYGLVHSNQENARFDQIIENLIWLKEYKQRQGSDLPRISLSNVVSNLNSHRGLDMMKTGVKVGAGNVSYRPIDTFDRTNQYALGKEHLDQLRTAFPEIRQLAAENNIATNTEVFDQIIALRESNSLPSPCFAGWLYPFVLANGDVTYCCVSREVLGNLEEKSFKEIWFAPDRKQLNNAAIKMHKTQTAIPRSRCFGCEQMVANIRIYGRLRFLWGRAAPAAPPAAQT